MSEKEKVKQIIEKYDKDLSKLSEEGTSLEYIANEANKKQRDLVEMSPFS